MILLTRCFLCSGNNFRLLFQKDNRKIVKCVKCAVILTLSDKLTPPRPDISGYSQKEYIDYHLRKNVQKLLRLRAVKRLREIKGLCRGKRLLDIGSGMGDFLISAKNRGFPVFGLEPNKELYNYLKKSRLPVFQGFLKDLKPDKQFDVITYWDVLEHTANPVDELKLAGRHLSKKGIIALQMPNINSFWVLIAKDKFSWLTPKEHLVHFSPTTLRLTLNKAGFQVLEIKTESGSVGFFSTIIRDLFSTNVNFKTVRKLLLFLALVFDRALSYIGNPESRILSLFEANNLIIAYARKKK